MDRAGNVYISDLWTARVWRVNSDGTFSPFAGTGQQGSGPENTTTVPALAFSLLSPQKMAFSSAGDLYLMNGRWVLKITSDGMLHHVAELSGPGIIQYQGYLIALDAADNVYVAGEYQVYRVGTAGDLTLVAGTGKSWAFTDGCTAAVPGVHTAANANLGFVWDIAIDSSGRIYIADVGTTRVRRVDRDGTIRTVAGAEFSGAFGGDGGLATNALLGGTSGLAFDSRGNLYIADSANNRIRRVTPDGIIQTVAGGTAVAGEDPACFPQSDTNLVQPGGVAVDAADNLYVADTGNDRVIVLKPDGAFVKIGDVPHPQSVAATRSGTIYVGDGYKFGIMTGSGLSPLDDTFGSALAVDPAGNVYYRRLYPNGIVKRTGVGVTFAGVFANPGSLAADAQETIYYTNGSGSGAGVLMALTKDCLLTTIVTTVPIGYSGSGYGAIAVAPTGEVYLGDGTHVWRIPPRRLDQSPAGLALLGVSVLNGATRQPRYITPACPHFCPSQTNEAIAPGEMVVIQGACLGPMRNLTAAGNNGFVPTTLGETHVTFDGVPAPIISVTSGEIITIVPYETAGATSQTMAVSYHGASQNITLDAVAASPGIFPSSLSRAKAGSIFTFYATGEGQTIPAGVTGRLPFDTLPSPALPVAVSIDASPADLLYAGASPGLIGMIQISFRVPDGLAPGVHVLKLAVGNASTSQQIVIAN